MAETTLEEEANIGLIGSKAVGFSDFKSIPGFVAALRGAIKKMPQDEFDTISKNLTGLKGNEAAQGKFIGDLKSKIKERGGPDAVSQQLNKLSSSEVGAYMKGFMGIAATAQKMSDAGIRQSQENPFLHRTSFGNAAGNGYPYDGGAAVVPVSYAPSPAQPVPSPSSAPAAPQVSAEQEKWKERLGSYIGKDSAGYVADQKPQLSGFLKGLSEKGVTNDAALKLMDGIATGFLDTRPESLSKNLSGKSENAKGMHIESAKATAMEKANIWNEILTRNPAAAERMLQELDRKPDMSAEGVKKLWRDHIGAQEVRLHRAAERRIETIEGNQPRSLAEVCDRAVPDPQKGKGTGPQNNDSPRRTLDRMNGTAQGGSEAAPEKVDPEKYQTVGRPADLAAEMLEKHRGADGLKPGESAAFDDAARILRTDANLRQHIENDPELYQKLATLISEDPRMAADAVKVAGSCSASLPEAMTHHQIIAFAKFAEIVPEGQAVPASLDEFAWRIAANPSMAADFKRDMMPEKGSNMPLSDKGMQIAGTLKSLYEKDPALFRKMNNVLEHKPETSGTMTDQILNDPDGFMKELNKGDSFYRGLDGLRSQGFFGRMIAGIVEAVMPFLSSFASMFGLDVKGLFGKWLGKGEDNSESKPETEGEKKKGGPKTESTPKTAPAPKPEAAPERSNPGADATPPASPRTAPDGADLAAAANGRSGLERPETMLDPLMKTFSAAHDNVARDSVPMAQKIENALVPPSKVQAVEL
ncbi:MAG: hypothetical protein HY370_04770 [Proteobacteria bacterium]|nr:hypothetical protein [Pseudomonadota bacterium]